MRKWFVPCNDFPFRCSRCGKQAPRAETEGYLWEKEAYRVSIMGEATGEASKAVRILCWPCIELLEKWMVI